MNFRPLTGKVKQIIETSSFDGVEIILHNQIGIINNHIPYCVLGVLCTDEGLKIEKYLLSYLMFKYKVICVRQNPPGILAEYPALRIAQRLSLETNIPILYLHTKGASNVHPTQSRIVNMWIDEFVRKKHIYEKNLKDYDLLAPFCGFQRIAWFNGFIATPSAFSSINTIAQSDNRYVYELLFSNTNIRYWGHVFNNIVRNEFSDNTSLVFEYLISNYSTKRSYLDFFCRIHYNYLKKFILIRKNK